MATSTPLLEVGKERLLRDIGVERLWVPDFLHTHIFDGGKDKLRILTPRRLLGATVGALGLVRRFRARADDIDCCVVGSNACWFGELRVIAHFVSFHQPNEANQVVDYLCFIVGDLEEEWRQDLPDLSEIGF